jgi:outer membrane protein OmpA-like peptidoglycan-associated protein
MKRFYKSKALTLMIIVPSALIIGCTTNPYTGQEQVSKTAVGAGVGAAGGAAIGAIFGHGTGAAIGAASGAVLGGVIGNIMDRQDAELRQQLQGTGVQVARDPRTGDIRLIMPGDITFATNSADIRPGFYSTLNSVAIVLRKYNKTVVEVDGFTDNTGTAMYNQQLSENRAQSVATYFGSQGINPNRLSVRGFGERHPIATNASVNGRSLNRRVEIRIHQI